MASPFWFGANNPDSLNLLCPAKDNNNKNDHDEEMEDSDLDTSLEFDISHLDDLQFDPLNFLENPDSLDDLSDFDQFHDNDNNLDVLEALIEDIEGNSSQSMDLCHDIPKDIFLDLPSLPEPVSYPTAVASNGNDNASDKSSGDLPVTIAKPASATQPSHVVTDQEYRDFSQVSDETVLAMVNYRSMKGRPKEAFPVKLYKILERSITDKYTSIISWLPHGRAFKLHDTRGFIEIVMPKFFYQTKITSFQRQLNIYGFRKLTQGVDRGSYCHELFLHGRPGLCTAIIRLKMKPEFSSESEPNLYAMHPMPHLSVPSIEASKINSGADNGCINIQPASFTTQVPSTLDLYPIANPALSMHQEATIQGSHTQLACNMWPVQQNVLLAPRKITPKINICLSTSKQCASNAIQSADKSTKLNGKKSQKQSTSALGQHLSRVSYLFPLALLR